MKSSNDVIDMRILYQDSQTEIEAIANMVAGLSSGLKNVAPPGSTPTNTTQYLDKGVGNFQNKVERIEEKIKLIKEATPSHHQNKLGRAAGGG